MFWHLKRHFLATNSEQHVANLSIIVAHFGIFKAKFVCTWGDREWEVCLKFIPRVTPLNVGELKV